MWRRCAKQACPNRLYSTRSPGETSLKQTLDEHLAMLKSPQRRQDILKIGGTQARIEPTQPHHECLCLDEMSAERVARGGDAQRSRVVGLSSQRFRYPGGGLVVASGADLG